MNGVRTQARNGRRPPHEFVALDHVLHDMRLYKSRASCDLMRKSAQIAARAHQRAMRFCRPGLTEHEVEAELVHEFRRHNADTAYEPIVGGGANSCVLHYRDNNQPLADGDLLLIDAGCEYECYASDITRTFRSTGAFRRRSARSTRSCSRPSARRSPQYAPAITGMPRTRPPCASSPRA